MNSLIASAKGTGIPMREGLLGPFRSWIYPRAFRSIKVKKAMASRAVTIIMRIEMN